MCVCADSMDKDRPVHLLLSPDCCCAAATYTTVCYTSMSLTGTSLSPYLLTYHLVDLHHGPAAVNHQTTPDFHHHPISRNTLAGSKYINAQTSLHTSVTLHEHTMDRTIMTKTQAAAESPKTPNLTFTTAHLSWGCSCLPSSPTAAWRHQQQQQQDAPLQACLEQQQPAMT